MALITVLWLVSLLTVLALSSMTISSRERRGQVDAFAYRSAELLADGALRLTLLELLGASEGPGPEEAPVRIAVLGAERIPVMIERERGRIDVNTADPQILVAYLGESGWRRAEAEALVARLQDWIDADDSTRPGGAERAEYAAAGRRAMPRNAPLEAVEEIRQIMGGEGVDPALLDGLTVYTHAAAPVSTTDVKESLPSWRGELLRLTACADMRDDTAVCRRAIVRLTGHVEEPWQVFQWRTQSGREDR